MISQSKLQQQRIFNPFPNMEDLVDVSVDIGHSDKVIHLFGEIDGIRK